MSGEHKQIINLGGNASLDSNPVPFEPYLTVLCAASFPGPGPQPQSMRSWETLQWAPPSVQAPTYMISHVGAASCMDEGPGHVLRATKGCIVEAALLLLEEKQESQQDPKAPSPWVYKAHLGSLFHFCLTTQKYQSPTPNTIIPIKPEAGEINDLPRPGEY